MPTTATRPTIEINGRTHEALTAALLHLDVTEGSSEPASCSARFSNWGPSGRTAGFLFFDRKALDFGAAVRVRLSDVVVFEGRIVRLDADFGNATAPTVSMRALDRLIDLEATRRTRTFADMSDADIVHRIAGDHWMAAQVDLTGPTYASVAQLGQTDLAFLRERLSGLDAWVWLEDGVLHAGARSASRGDPVTLHQGAELIECSVSADLARQRTRITVSGWDVQSKSAIAASATEAVLGAVTAGRLTAAATLRAGFGEREDTIAQAVPLSAAEAQRRAEARFTDLAHRFVVSRGSCAADPRIRAGVHVDLQGLGPIFSGRYWVAEARHAFDPTHGTRTTFTAETPAIGVP